MSLNSLSDLHEQIALCRNCHSLKEYWKFASGVHGQCASRIMVVGESAHKESIDAGKYYARNSLRSILGETFDLDKECYLTDLVKCDKEFLESQSGLEQAASSCFNYLVKEIEFIEPKVIITVGELAFRYLTKISGSFIERQGDGERYLFNNIPVIPIIHPSNQNRNYGKKSWQEISYGDSVKKIFIQALNM